MRRAIYTELVDTGKFKAVYQPHTAPEGCATPYAVIKMYGDDGVPDNFKGQKEGFSIFIYTDPDSYVLIDSLVMAVRETLDKVLLVYDSPVRYFRPEYIKTTEDAFDDRKNLFVKRVDFNIPGIRI